jgi:tRNA 5-methylaminomethyl-2-thiouridine biosynthesis bifunctional protein
MKDPLYNQRFDDIYFSALDGAAETQHVFINGNDLPARLKKAVTSDCGLASKRFTIFETGFGTGLNFLSAIKCFRENAPADMHLHFMSVEKYPLAKAEIMAALSPWEDSFASDIQQMIDCYPHRIAGVHKVFFDPRITLTLFFDDVSDLVARAHVAGGVDAWFLDGFAPAKNPQMWGDDLYAFMRQNSHAQTSFSSFTAAGHVRRGLQAHGFEVEKTQGFGRKRDMIKGTFVAGESAAHKPSRKNTTQKIAIIGGGLAGTSCAYLLKKQGLSPVIFETAAHVAAGASGNPVGLYNPRFMAHRTPVSDFYTASYAALYRLLSAVSQTQDVGFRPMGALHLINKPEKQKRFDKMIENWQWHHDHMRLMNAQEATEIAGTSLELDALHLPDSGMVSPKELCAYYARNVDIRYHETVLDIKRTAEGWQVGAESFDVLVLACAQSISIFKTTAWVPFETVRGQITKCIVSNNVAPLKSALCYGGYATPADESGACIIGSTFQKWRDDIDLDAEDDRDNLNNLMLHAPQFASALEVRGARAALRVAAQDRVPVCGAVYDEEGIAQDDLYISAAHGSHGLLSSLGAAMMIVDDICETPSAFYGDTIAALSPQRFILRQQKKQGRFSS